MKAILIGKAWNIDDCMARTAEQKRKHGAEAEQEIIITKTITLGEQEFDKFGENLLLDSDIVKTNKKHMGMADDKCRCIEITAKESGFGILIYSSGYDYARYTAIIEKK